MRIFKPYEKHIRDMERYRLLLYRL